MKAKFITKIIVTNIITAAFTLIASAMAMFYIPLSFNGVCTLLLISGLFALIIALAIDLYTGYVAGRRRHKRILQKMAYSKSLYAVPDSRY